MQVKYATTGMVVVDWTGEQEDSHHLLVSNLHDPLLKRPEVSDGAGVEQCDGGDVGHG